jgi:hypothetical protein
LSWNEVGVDPETSTGLTPPEASSVMFSVMFAGDPEAIEDAVLPATSEAEKAGEVLAFSVPVTVVRGAINVIVVMEQLVLVAC